MFVGHYAPAFVIKRYYPKVPVWVLFLSVQVLDFLHLAGRATGLEIVHTKPEVAGPLSLDAQSTVYSHSLGAAVVWSALAALLLLRKKAWATAVSVAVFSHWIADLIVHQPDLAVLTNDGPMMGLGLWNYPIASYVFELGALFAALLFWSAECARQPKVLVTMGIMTAAQTVFFFTVPPPMSNLAFCIQATLTLLFFVGLSWWAFDRRPESPSKRSGT